MLRLQLLGPPEFFLFGNDLLRVPEAIKTRRIALIFLSYLVVTQKAIYRDEAARYLWRNEDTIGLSNRISTLKNDLRKLLSNEYIIFKQTSINELIYFDKTKPFWLDVEHLIEAAEQNDLQLLKEKSDLLRGVFLEGFQYRYRGKSRMISWVEEKRRDIQELAYFVLGKLIQQSATTPSEKMYLEKFWDLAERLELAEAKSKTKRHPNQIQQDLKRKIAVAILTDRDPQPYYQTLREKFSNHAQERQFILANEQACYDWLFDNIGLLQTNRVHSKVIKAKKTARTDSSQNNFVGREKELLQFDEFIQNRLVVALVGMGGVGKTALVRQIGSRYQTAFTDGILVASAKAGDFGIVLTNWLQMLGQDPLGLDLENKAIALGHLLKNKQALLVLDDVKEQQNLAFYKQLIRWILPSHLKSRLLITTRNLEFAEAIDAAIIHINELTKSDSLALVTRLIDRQIENNDKSSIEKLCQILGRLPLAIEISSKRIRMRQQNISKFVDSLLQKKGTLANKNFADLNTVFEVSWEMLSLNQQVIFSVLSVFKDYSFSVDAFMVILTGLNLKHFQNIDYYDVEELLSQLVALSLLRYDFENDRYYLHTLIAEFALLKVKETKLNSQQALEIAYIEYYLSYVKTYLQDIFTLKIEWIHILEALNTAYRLNLADIYMQLCHLLEEPWFLNGDYEQARQHYQQARHIAQEHDNLENLAYFDLQIARAFIEVGHFDDANTFIEECYRISVEIASQAEIAKVLYHRGWIAIERHRYIDAENLLGHCIAICQQLIEKNEENSPEYFIIMANALHLLADIPFYAKAYALVENMFNDVIAMLDPFDKSSAVDTSLLRWHLLMGLLLGYVARYAEAQTQFERALDYSKRAQNRAERAIILYNWAYTYYMEASQSDEANTELFKIAEAKIAESISLLKRLGDRLNLGRAYRIRSKIHSYLKDYGEALHWNRICFDIFEELRAYPQLISILLERGELYIYLEQKEMVRHCSEQVHTILKTQNLSPRNDYQQQLISKLASYQGPSGS